MPGRARGGKVVLLVALAAGVVSGPLGWVVTDRLERDNDFCNACHLGPDLPLHAEIRSHFDARPGATLAAAHGAAPLERAGETRDFRCIDCHGGASWLGRARVKALAAKDGFWYAVGRFEEPTSMRWPLWDEDCRQCHASFEESRAEDWEAPRFHQLPVHNVALGVDCVECHLVHETGAEPAASWLHPTWVRSQCARCHSEFREGSG